MTRSKWCLPARPSSRASSSRARRPRRRAAGSGRRCPRSCRRVWPSTGNSARNWSTSIRRDSLGGDPSISRAVIIERSMNDDFLSNSYLVGDEPGGHGVLIDSGGPPEPLLEAIKENDLTVEHLLLTHHHGDHVMNNGVFKKELGVEIIAHPIEAELIDDVDRETEPNEVLEVGGLTIEFTHTPGHAAGMLAIKVNGERRVHRRHAVQGLGGRRARARVDRLRRPEELDHGQAHEAAARDAAAPRSHRPDDGRRRVGEQPVHPRLARRGRGVRGALRGLGRGRDARPVGPRLRRRPQGVGPLGPVRQGRHRAGESRSSGSRSRQRRTDKRQPATAANDEGPPRRSERPSVLRLRNYWPQTGQAEAPRCAYSIAARLSCSASGAAAGSPEPPTLAQVCWSNWYLPR